MIRLLNLFIVIPIMKYYHKYQHLYLIYKKKEINNDIFNSQIFNLD